MIIARDKDHLEHREWPLRAGHPVRGIVVRQIDGDDELEAGRMARTRKTLDDEELGAAILVEQLRLSIVAVRRTERGRWEPVRQPFESFDRWPSKTRRLVLLAYKALNHLSEEEEESFTEGGKVINAGRAPTEASPADEVELVEEETAA